MLYHIFRVWDYKGGELSSDVNLTREDLIENLAECLSNWTEECTTLEEIKTVVDRCLVQKYEEGDWLGNHEGFEGEIYFTEEGNSTLKELKWKGLAKDLSNKLFEWLQEEQE